MGYEIRPGRPDDYDAIAEFTEGTFEWGDYVSQVFHEWLADPEGTVLVACNEDDRVVAMARAAMLSRREAWLQGARVHPDYRRRGIGMAINDAAVGWARGRGALVARLAVEKENVPAHGQVAKLGYRDVARWAHARRRLTGYPRRPVSPEDRLRLADRSEVEPSWLAWSTSELASAAHALCPVGWQWRKMTLEDVEAALVTRNLWVCPSGWAIGETDAGVARSSWLVSGPGEVKRLLGAVIGHFSTRAAELEVTAPDLGWLTEALTDEGFQLQRLIIYEKQVG